MNGLSNLFSLCHLLKHIVQRIQWICTFLLYNSAPGDGIIWNEAFSLISGILKRFEKDSFSNFSILYLGGHLKISH